MVRRFSKAEKLANYTRDIMKCRQEKVGPFTLDVELAKKQGWAPESIARASMQLVKMNVRENERIFKAKAS